MIAAFSGIVERIEGKRCIVYEMLFNCFLFEEVRILCLISKTERAGTDNGSFTFGCVTGGLIKMTQLWNENSETKRML